MKRVGLIAGNGRFPLIFAESAKREGVSVTAVAHIGETISGLESSVDKIFWIKVGELGKLIKIFKKEGIREAVMAGGIKKTRIFRDIIPDLRSLSLLTKIRHKKDDAILRGVANELQKEGIIVRESTLYLSSIIATDGNMTSRRLCKKELEDITYGWEIAKDIGRHDIGQCIVVKDKVVLAVEGVEGTDEAIKRGGRLCGGGAVVIKVSKPHQDLRFDVPAIGVETIISMKEAKASVIALEAGKTILLDRDETIRKANEAKISIMGKGWLTP
ncbi:MAG: LpxI family protein [Nitrospirota bacterium]